MDLVKEVEDQIAVIEDRKYILEANNYNLSSEDTELLKLFKRILSSLKDGQ